VWTILSALAASSIRIELRQLAIGCSRWRRATPIQRLLDRLAEAP